jgi:hypothetical protein
MRVLGQPYAISNIVRGFDPVRGPSTEVTFTGTIEALNALNLTLASDQTARLVQSTSPLAELIVTTPDYYDSTSTDQSTLKYELLGNDIERSIWNHPSAIALSDEDKTNIKAAILDPQGSAIEAIGDALSVYNLLRNGTDSYTVSQFVFRVTQTVSSRFTTRVGFSNLNRIYSTTSMVSETGPPSTLIFSVSSIPSSTAPSGYAYGWLKRTPTVSQTAGNKFEITIEYWLETWSTFIYGAAV